MGFCKGPHVFKIQLALNSFRRTGARSSPRMINTRVAGYGREQNKLGEARKLA